MTWPTRPAAPRNEQRELAFTDTLEAKWVRFRESWDGQRFLAMFAQLAIRDAAQGLRLSSKKYWEEVRATLHIKANNSFTAHAARWAEDNFPEQLRGRFEKRQRDAA